MNRQINLLKDLKGELQRIEKLQKKLYADLKGMPEGGLMRRREGSLYHVVSREGIKTQKRLSKERQEDRELIAELKYKKYIKEALPVLECWIKNIRKLLKEVNVYDPMQIEKKLKEQYKGLKGMGIFLEGDINIAEWERKQYPMMYEDGMIYPSEGGLMTRSKSESQIASKYETLGWIFEYEPVIEVGDGKILRPDFRIIHPQKRKYIYHEHFGMMDDPEYALKAVRKIEEYAKVGICLCKNLVITVETKQQPLTYKTIDETIRKIELL